ncbi:MAG: SDR family oxidoreductase [Pseudomonadota bacterium]|nr:SDR family oxidoreductase [Pseudomonadota bacterium]
MSELLQDRVVIVSGAARCIGQTYAKGLAAQGARVAAADILDCGETVAAIESAGGEALGVALDVTDYATCRAMAATVLERFGRIDGLVNNAAMFGPSSKNRGAELVPFDEISEDAWDQMMNINVKGMWNGCKAVVPAMREAGYGKIVNIASNTISLGNPYLLHYVTSKGAVATMTRCLSRELGPQGIRVNCIAPGFIQSQASIDIMDKFDAHDITDQMKAICSLGREQYAEDLVGTVVYLNAELSDFVTGQIISVDGGACFTGM